MVNLKVKKSVVLGWERKIDLAAQNETVHIRRNKYIDLVAQYVTINFRKI